MDRGLRELRREHVLSMRDLAMRSGVSKTTIVEIEADRRYRPHPTTIRKLAAALEMEPRELARLLEAA